MKVTLSKEYISGLTDIARDLDIPAYWLDAIIYRESGRKWNATNEASGAFGFIQFLPSTISSMGAKKPQNTAESFHLTKEYLSQYFDKFGKPKSPEILYSYIFYPVMNNGKFAKIGTREYELNKALDKNRDGVIDFSDLRAHLEPQLKISEAIFANEKVSTQKPIYKEPLFDVSILLILLLIALFFLWKK